MAAQSSQVEGPPHQEGRGSDRDPIRVAEEDEALRKSSNLTEVTRCRPRLSALLPSFLVAGCSVSLA